MAPCLFRVRARVLRVCPTDARMWTRRSSDVTAAGAAAVDVRAASASVCGRDDDLWSYCMVLQLCDAEE
eukprot:CAMPEP_0174697330 /NCGR_PEP_ID=MMETSP1094-20130205/3228_1 /TAXON_ID=156173 /ORGANISM="Chrysochromulina brevifilum, Strain UTEX LB 985" /LENGTH=68 /DNA_ID=CAMNT_0015894283 /DNA_START=18 /DNA_END=221 /DNA_ORIENTATION=-